MHGLRDSQRVQPFEDLLHRLERMRDTPAASFNSSSSGYCSGRDASSRMTVRPIDGAAFGEEREQMLVLFAVVVVNVRGADARLHQCCTRSSTPSMMLRVAGVEAVVQIEVRHARETLFSRSALENPFGMFSSSTSTPRWRRTPSALRATECRIHFSLVVFLAATPRCWIR